MSMYNEGGPQPQPLFLTTEHPTGWLQNTRRKAWRTTPSLDVEALQRNQNARWKTTTGVDPQDSQFTLIVPIHNERTFLESSLTALALSDIPRDVHAQIVFVTNACSDNSAAIVHNFMNRMGDETTPINPRDKFSNPDHPIKDPHISSHGLYTKTGNIEYYHIDTTTPGKPNAMDIGNALALQQGHKIAMNIDANNFPEPDAISKLFGKAHQGIATDNTDGVVSGFIHYDMKPSLLTPVFKLAKTTRAEPPKSEVHGCLIAWDTEMVEKIGGIPKTVTEDYALGVLARLNEKAVTRAASSYTWAYTPNNVGDRVTEVSRFVKGAQQLIAIHPEATGIVQEELYWAQNEQTRLRKFIQDVKTHPLKLPITVAKQIFREYAIFLGKRDYKKAPVTQSWKEISSTKR